MEKENFSKKICELCGIKPIYKVKHFNGITEVWSPAFNKEELRFAKAQKQILEQKEVYPDFENNNNNFMKLLEIVSKKASVSFCHNGTYYGCSIHYFFKDIFEAVEGTLQHNFLNSLLVQDLRNPCKPSLLEQIKQAIKQTEWEI